MNVLGIKLTAPSLMGLLRMLGFTLTAIALVEIGGSFNPGVCENEGSLSFIIGGFSIGASRFVPRGTPRGRTMRTSIGGLRAPNSD